jgi:Pyruvate/2-oxoacid:ferredoxin oxidoreductase delta subunit
MAHHTLKSGYDRLVHRLNKFPQGAPPSETLFSILAVLMNEEEAARMALLPIVPFGIPEAARAWKVSAAEAEKLLDALASRALLLDSEQDGQKRYTLPPPMAGFFEFSMMRIRRDIDQALLGKLLYQYLNVEDEFIKALFTTGETQLGRTFVHEPALPSDKNLLVLDYERASEVIKSATHRGVGICYCRHKMEHMGRNCDAPMEICMTFNGPADSLVRHGYARPVSVEEGLELLLQAYEHNLVQFGENVRQRVGFICNCCGCCCEALIAARKFAHLYPVHTTNFLPEVEESSCTGCGRCVQLCPVEAMTMVSANDPHAPKRQVAKLVPERCLGCGVCARGCTKKSLLLVPRSERVLTPVNSAHRVVLMAIERGDFQNLLFGQQAFASHRAMAAILGVILKLPPVKQVMASRQMKSRYLERLLAGGHPA